MILNAFLVYQQFKNKNYKIALPLYVADFKIFSATFTADFESGA